ncbi:hypothetical protein ACIBG0_36295 [Nocardia sp. NPDC050630]|uniref:hypothetical protein n=1 Tax=Nocardia sp. NPDC050630 TaxID=3364321 RepID=UPI0037AD701B
MTNGKAEATVILRPMGPMTLYEVDVQVWGDLALPSKYKESIPKMTCDSEPLELDVKYSVPVPDGRTPWVGVVWTEASRLGVMEQGARINVETGEYQRWKWLPLRNAFRLWSAPKGRWQTATARWTRNQFVIPALPASRESRIDPAAAPDSIDAFGGQV